MTTEAQPQAETLQAETPQAETFQAPTLPAASVTAAVTAPGTKHLDLLGDVELQITIELGRTRRTIRELLALRPGSVLELDRAAGSPVDLLVNGRLLAHGEVVVVDEQFGVRITEIVGVEGVV